MGVGLVGRADVLEQAKSVVLGGAGVLFVGEPGVGKTRLLAETLALLVADGWHTERFVASAAARNIAFGPLISLLPSGTADRTQQVAGVRRTLIARAEGRPIALAIDDAHLLDDASLACLVDLAHHSDVVLLGTARSTEPTPPDLTALWASEAIVRIDVEPLGRADTTELVGRLLGGSVSEVLGEQVWEHTQGSPLLVRELLHDAAAQRLLVDDADVWQLRGKLRPGARMHELVQARTHTLSAPAQQLLELLACAEPLAVTLLTDDEGKQLDGLEQSGLARGELLAGQWVARVEHPLITEAIAAAIPTRRRLELLREVAGRVIAAGFSAPGEALRTAAWIEECGDPLPASVALAAGREALASLALERACELARMSLEELPRESHLLLGEALRLQARAAEAEAALAVAAELADDDDETIVRVAMWRSTLRAHHADDPDGALTLLNAAADRVSAPEQALELRSEAAFLAGLLGRFDVAVDTNRRILAADRSADGATGGLDLATRWTATMNLLFGQVMLADVERIDEPITAMAGMLDEIAPSRPEAVDLYWALVAGAHILNGELAHCEAVLVPHVKRCLATDDSLHGVTAAILVLPLLLRGSPHTIEMAAAGCAGAEQSDPYLIGPIAHATHTLAWAHVGDLERARAALADVDVSHTGDLRLDGFIGRAQAAVLALEGHYDQAAETTAAAGRRCLDGTYVHFGLLSLHDAVRYGRADLVADDMRRLSGPQAAPLIGTLVRHAVAQQANDADALIEVAVAMAAMEARTLVAEVLDDAARAATDQTAADRSATAAALWRRATPRLNAHARPVSTPLSDRELDVVERALRGEPSREIAEQLFLSTRTVDNHLAQVYRKLAIDGRAELAIALAPIPIAG